MRLLFALLFSGSFLATAAQAVQPGTPAPPFALPTAVGDNVTLAGLRGRVVYVDFWASWCTPCRRSFPWMNTLVERYGKDGLAIVGINVDKRRSDAERFLRDTPAAFTIAFDERGITPSAYEVPGMPSSYVIDRDGNVVAVEDGYHEERKAAVEARIRALLGKR